MSAAEVGRVRAIAGRLGDEDFARLDPPADLWGRIAATLDAEPAATAATAAAGDWDGVGLGRVRAIAGRLGDEDFARLDPPADLWRRIAAAATPAAATSAGADRSSPDPHPGTDVAFAAGPIAELDAPVVSLDARRRRRHRRVAAVVAAAAAVVAVTGAALLVQGPSTTDDEPQLVASTELEPLEPVGGATAEARLVRQDDHLELELEAHDMAAAPAGQHYELWLLDPASASAEPVSLGAMSASTSVPVPAGVDPEEYDVVDISLQAAGETEHSGHSLLRGTLA